MCYKAKPSTLYRKCGHKVEGAAITYYCDQYPKGPKCANPPFKDELLEAGVNAWCDKCLTEGKGKDEEWIKLP